jgi:hypothetical protein
MRAAVELFRGQDPSSSLALSKLIILHGSLKPAIRLLDAITGRVERFSYSTGQPSSFQSQRPDSFLPSTATSFASSQSMLGRNIHAPQQNPFSESQ